MVDFADLVDMCEAHESRRDRIEYSQGSISKRLCRVSKIRRGTELKSMVLQCFQVNSTDLLRGIG